MSEPMQTPRSHGTGRQFPYVSRVDPGGPAYLTATREVLYIGPAVEPRAHRAARFQVFSRTDRQTHLGYVDVPVGETALIPGLMTQAAGGPLLLTVMEWLQTPAAISPERPAVRVMVTPANPLLGRLIETLTADAGRPGAHPGPQAAAHGPAARPPGYGVSLGHSPLYGGYAAFVRSFCPARPPGAPQLCPTCGSPLDQSGRCTGMFAPGRVWRVGPAPDGEHVGEHRAAAEAHAPPAEQPVAMSDRDRATVRYALVVLAERVVRSDYDSGELAERLDVTAEDPMPELLAEIAGCMKRVGGE